MTPANPLAVGLSPACPWPLAGALLEALPELFISVAEAAAEAAARLIAVLLLPFCKASIVARGGEAGRPTGG